jgi:hypothetical protein
MLSLITFFTQSAYQFIILPYSFPLSIMIFLSELAR